MHLKFIACEVLTREVCLAVAASSHLIDLEFTPKDAHEDSGELRRLIQERIDRAEAGTVTYDAVLLGYGLCGNSAAGLRSKKTPLVIPRAHDCCTLFLGDRRRYEETFSSSPSMPFSSAGYCERGGAAWHAPTVQKALGMAASYEECVQKYGEDNAKFLWETLSPYLQDRWDKLVYIDVPESRHLGWEQKCREQAEREGKELLSLEGSTRLIRALAAGEWDEREFLLTEAGSTIEGVYDWHEIMRSQR